MDNSRMPEVEAKEKRVGLHKAIFRPFSDDCCCRQTNIVRPICQKSSKCESRARGAGVVFQASVGGIQAAAVSILWPVRRTAPMTSAHFKTRSREICQGRSAAIRHASRSKIGRAHV